MDGAEWDLGGGLTWFGYKLYPGSRDDNSFVLPIPYFTFSSPMLEVDRGVKGFLYTSDTILFDVSADFSLPVNSSRSSARQGMPDLDAVLQLGPAVGWRLSQRDSPVEMKLEVPLRLAVSARLRNTGWLLEPRFHMEMKRQNRQGLAYGLTTGLTFATQAYNAYYYDVDTASVTPQRAEFAAEKGYAGAFLRLRLSYRADDVVYWMYARYSDLRDTVFVDSPLVETRNYTIFGVGVSWIFAGN